MDVRGNILKHNNRTPPGGIPYKIAVKFNSGCLSFPGKDYLSWSELIQTTLKGKGKLNYLLDSGPKSGDPTFDDQDKEDSMIMV